MIGILGGMGTQAGLDFCNKLAILYRGKIDQEYPLFLLFNKSNIPGRPESIGVQTKNLSNRKKNKKIEKKYSLVLESFPVDFPIDSGLPGILDLLYKKNKG